MALDDYLTRLQAKRAALAATALASPPGRLAIVCVCCGAEAARAVGSSGAGFGRCAACGMRAAWEPVTAVIAELDRAIAWAKQAAGWRQTV